MVENVFGFKVTRVEQIVVEFSPDFAGTKEEAQQIAEEFAVYGRGVGLLHYGIPYVNGIKSTTDYRKKAFLNPLINLIVVEEEQVTEELEDTLENDAVYANKFIHKGEMTK